MDKIITYDNLRRFAYSNDKICTKPIKGVIVGFFGLGDMTMYGEDPGNGVMYGQMGILYVVPYNNPWSWMNRQAVGYTDEVLDVLFKKYDLPDDLPIVSSGGSMGGQQSLVYSAYAKRPLVASVANCPPCDMLYHYTERRDLPRTMYSAFYNYDGTMENAIKSVSPVHLAAEGKMPKITYSVFHCDCDRMVNIDSHSRKLAAEMEKKGYDIHLYVSKDRDHCQLTDEMRELYTKCCVDPIVNHGV